MSVASFYNVEILMCKSHFLPSSDQWNSFLILGEELYFSCSCPSDSVNIYHVANSARCNTENLVRYRKQNNWWLRSSKVRSNSSATENLGRGRWSGEMCFRTMVLALGSSGRKQAFWVEIANFLRQSLAIFSLVLLIIEREWIEKSHESHL